MNGDADERLCEAIINRNLRDIEVILDEYPDIVNSFIDNDGRTPLTLVWEVDLLRGNPRRFNLWRRDQMLNFLHILTIIGLLVKRGARIDQSDGRGLYPIHAAVLSITVLKHNIPHFPYFTFLNVLYFLGSTINETVQQICTIAAPGNTALLLAAEERDHNVVRFLLGESTDYIYLWEIDPNIQNREGNTALHLAIRRENNEIIDSMFVDISNDFINRAGIETLPSAVKIVKSLIRHPDIDPNLQNREGNTALHLAVENRYCDIVKLLLGHPDIDRNIGNREENTALHLAVENGYHDIVKLLLILRHLDIDQNIGNREGNTALHLAVENRYCDIVKLLLRRPDIDRNIGNREGNTALHLAVEKRYCDIVKSLLRHSDIDRNIRNREGNTALHLAVENRYCDIVKLLLRHPDIDRNIINRNQRMPINIAMDRGYHDILELLEGN